MENNINDIDKFFKDHLDGHESGYIPGAWENMEAMLDADNSGYVLKNIHRYILASVAGTIILAGSVVAYISGYSGNSSMYADDSAAATEQVAQAPTVTDETLNNSNTINTDNASIADINSTPSTITPSVENTSTNNSTSTAPAAPKATTPSKTKATATPKPAVVTDDETNDNVVEDVSASSVTTTEANNAIMAPFSKKGFSNILLNNKSLQFGSPQGLLATEAYLQKQRLSIDSAERAEKKITEMQRFYRLQFGIQAGGNFNRVLSNTSSDVQIGSGLMAGFFFSKNLNSRWALNAELNYLRSSSNSIGRTVKQTTYFFEKTTTTYFLVTKNFDYLQIPISVSYSFTPKHKFTLGAVGMYMINARTEVAEQTEKFAEKSSNTTTQNGVYEDLNTFNYGLQAGYEFNLPGMYSIGLRYNQMFRDITNNSYFDNSKKHLPAHMQLFVKLNLTR